MMKRQSENAGKVSEAIQKVKGELRTKHKDQVRPGGRLRLTSCVVENKFIAQTN